MLLFFWSTKKLALMGTCFLICRINSGNLEKIHNKPREASNFVPSSVNCTSRRYRRYLVSERNWCSRGTKLSPVVCTPRVCWNWRNERNLPWGREHGMIWWLSIVMLKSHIITNKTKYAFTNKTGYHNLKDQS